MRAVIDMAGLPGMYLDALPDGNGQIIQVASDDPSQDQLGTLQLGANAYICKPFSPRELVRQVRQLLAAPQGETSA